MLRLLFVAPLLLPAGALADVSSTELIENGARYDGQPVDYAGEVIGDAMPRGEHLWVNVSDGQNALGVWVARDAFPAIRHLGSYRAHGDVVRMHGIFHRACAEHGGDTDLHAATVEVVTPGTPTPHAVPDASLLLAGVLLLTSLGAWAAWKRRERALRSSGGRELR